MRALDPATARLASLVLHEVSQGKGSAVLEQARELTKRAPKAPDAHHALALCAAQAGQTQEADAAFRAALALMPGQPMILANRARFLGRQGQLRAAAECWSELLQRVPTDAGLWLEYGLLLLSLAKAGAAGRQSSPGERSRRLAAIASLRQALQLDDRLVRAWHGLGSALRDENELPEAELALRTALEFEPGSPVLWSSLAGVMRLAGRPSDAAEAYRHARALGEPAPEVLDAEVGALIDCLRIDEAREASDALLARFPGFAPAYATRANLNWEYGQNAGDPRAEVAPELLYRRAADAQPDNVELQYGLIGFLLESRQGEEAFERLQHLRHRSDDPRLVAMQANALEIAGHTERAARLYAEADGALGSRDISFNNAYVRHMLKAGRWSEAAARAERVVGIDPQNQETWAYLATAWRLVGDSREDWLCGYETLAAFVPVDTPSGWPDMEGFLEDLGEALRPLHLACNQPMAQSLRGGSQTPGRLFGRPDRRITALQQALVPSIERWLSSLPQDPSHPFLARSARTIRFTGSWSVKLWRSGSHANHFHSEGWMSSAFYVALPPSVRSAGNGAIDPQAGGLQLGQPPVELQLDLAPRRIILPREGHLALFPSYLWHGTVPFEDTEPRITVAFDMLPTP